jgi:pimeloyl-ACP methyl ester carboxylesterase
VALSLDLLIAELDGSPRVVSLSPNESGFDREVDVRLDGTRLAEFVFLLLYNESLARYLPATLTGIADGDPDAERWLARVGTRTLTAAYNANREGTYFAVQCHDRLPFTSGGFVDHDGGFGAAVPVEPLRNLCPAWEQGEAGAIIGTPVSSDLPTLLLSGTFDPITPSTFADAAADLLPNATIVTQDGRGHGIWFGNSCIAGIVQQFVADPLRTLDTSCADAGVPVDWAAP